MGRTLSTGGGDEPLSAYDTDFQAILIDLDALDVEHSDIDGGFDGGRVNLDLWRRSNVPIRFVTKDCRRGTKTLLDSFRSPALSMEEDELFSASRVLAMEIARRENRATVFSLGSDGLKRDLQKEGLRVIEKPMEIDYLADFVVVGDDENICYSKLTDALRCFDHGAQWAAADDEAVIVKAGRKYAGPGALVSAVEKLAGRPPDFQLGVPRPHIIHQAVRSTGVSPDKCLWIGTPQNKAATEAQQYGITRTMTVKQCAEFIGAL